MQLKLLAFAMAADRLGWREKLVEADPSETPGALLARIAPAFDFTTVRAAVDCEYHAWDAPIGPDRRELALLPPVSGG